MLWNAATHGLSIPRDGGAQAAGTAKRRAHQAARGSPPEAPTGFSSRGAGFSWSAGGSLVRVADGVGARRVFLERRAPLGAASSGRRRNPVADAFDRALGGIREGTAWRNSAGGAGTRHKATGARRLCPSAGRQKPAAKAAGLNLLGQSDQRVSR